jgi:SAM-dependent methyltransferase
MVIVKLKTLFIELILSLRLKKLIKKRPDLKHFMHSGPCPYKTAADYHRSKGEDPYVYGQSPLSTICKLFSKLKLTQHSKVLELGAGDFKVTEFLNQYFGFTVYGLEQIPAFCKIGRQRALTLKTDGIYVLEGNYLTTPFPDVDIAYLFGSNIQEETLIELLPKLKNISKILTVSFPLSDYSDDFTTVDNWTLLFVFGYATVYLNKPIGIK